MSGLVAEPVHRRSNNQAFESSETYLARARECIEQAQASNLRERSLILARSAERWIRLAERARQIERKQGIAVVE